MELLYSLLVIITIPMLAWSFLRHRHIAFTVLASAALLGIVNKVSLDKVCGDGWHSSSIGRQGACSHHGGVSSELTEVGGVVLVLCGLFLLVKFWRWKAAEDRAHAVAMAAAQAAKAAAPAPAPLPALSILPFVPKPPSLQDYEAFIPGWFQQGLSASTIVDHLQARGVDITQDDIKKYQTHSLRRAKSRPRKPA